VYLENGGSVSVSGLQDSLPFRWFNPKTGEWTEKGATSGTNITVQAPTTGPWVLFIGHQRSKTL
jgi:hypothetical protein